MKQRVRSGLRLAVGLMLALTVATLLPPSTPPASAADPVAPSDDLAAGSVLVKFKPLVPSFLADTTISVQGFRTVATVYGTDVRQVAVTPGTETQAIAGLRANPLVEYAEPDYLLRPLWIPDDTFYASEQWNLKQVNLEQAWVLAKGSSAVKVAVIDTGLNMNHPDRPVNIISPWEECTGAAAVTDSFNHGTHVSGIIAAASNNGTGVAGVAPGISLMPIKVECEQLIKISSASAAARYAADNGASVINISLGTSQLSQTWREAIEYANGKGRLVVAAAGNGFQAGNPAMYPAAFPGVLAVGASTHDDLRASYSQVQPYVAVVAPGGDASSAADPDVRHWIKSTYGDSYASMTGTSQASPHVAGLAGLIWSVNPGLSKAQVVDIITSTAVDLGAPGKDDQYGWGRIDAYAALMKAQTTQPQPTITPSPVPAIPTPTPIISNVAHRTFIPRLSKGDTAW